MKPLLIILSLAFLCISEDVYSGRRLPTQYEQQVFLPVLDGWMAKNWQEKVTYTGGYISQNLKDIAFCCIDYVSGHELYIVDIVFHAKWLEDDNRVIDEADMSQRLLFHVINGVIEDWDPLPAYRNESLT